MASARPSAKAVINEKGEAAVEKVKVSRYRAGKAPEYAPEDEEDFVPTNEKSTATPALPNDDFRNDARMRRLKQSRDERAVYEGEVVSSGKRRRHSEEEEDNDQLEPILQTESEKEEAVIQAALRAIEEEEENDKKSEEPQQEDDDERRLRLKQRAQQQRQQEEEELTRMDDEKEEESEYETEYEEEEDTFPTVPLLKPIFVPKSERATTEEKARAEKEAEKLEKERLQRLEERRKETHQIVAEEIKRSLEGQPVDASEMLATPDMVDDTDGVNEEEEYEQWKLRELKRVRRDKEEQERIEQERAETERRRNLTDAERKAEDAKDPEKQAKLKEKPKYRFLQKYYHKGAFFQEHDIVKERDFAEPTERDAINKELLPKVMQVKNFGRAGQTKYTHLVDQDTTKHDAAWVQKTPVNMRAVQKLGGLVGANNFDKPTSKKRKGA